MNADRRPPLLSDEDVRVLGDFSALVGHLVELRERGLLRLEDGPIMRSQRGGYLMAGPCDLTEAGSRSLEQDRRLGPRA
jgi:hypothetical protein